MANLWPDELDKIEIKAPVAILREQAALLGQKTKNLVKAAVERLDANAFWPGPSKPFNYRFVIVAPALGGYRFRLFDISHDEALYPVFISLDEDLASEVFDPSPVQKDDEGEFMAFLAEIFRSGKARQVIGAILAQSSDMEDPEE
jgi:hypothetical protein